jgi:hypothetical protein
MNPYSDLFIRLRQAKAHLEDDLAYRRKMQKLSRWRPIPLSLLIMALGFISLGLLCLSASQAAAVWAQIIGGTSSIALGGIFLILAAIV